VAEAIALDDDEVAGAKRGRQPATRLNLALSSSLPMSGASIEAVWARRPPCSAGWFTLPIGAVQCLAILLETWLRSARTGQWIANGGIYVHVLARSYAAPSCSPRC
jgi:hypothetical protein